MGRSSILFLSMIVPASVGMSTPTAPVASFSFGLSLATGTGGQLFTCFLVKEFEGRVLSTELVEKESFILEAQGLRPSKANPEGRNYFKEFGINTCLAFEDTIAGEYLYRCDPLDDLWKLRFQEYPFLLQPGQHPGLGWAESRNAPSGRQMMLLADYGIMYLTGLCRSENMFRLLRDMGDSAWVNNYRQGY